MNDRSEKKRILLVEDDLSLARGLKYALEKEGYAPHHVTTLAGARNSWDGGGWDLVLLDIDLPDGSGFDLCSEIGGKAPVVFLTASDEEVSVVLGLDMGADDYIAKPFRVNELLSRLRAVLRRSAPSSCPDDILSGNIRLDRTGARIYRDGAEVPLTATEYRLASLLLTNRGRTVTRERLLEQLWDREERFVEENTLSVYISRLRDKLGGSAIETARGTGYRWIG